jgi:predicted ribosomally synthesized peptide with SipW-like signal peptide
MSWRPDGRAIRALLSLGVVVGVGATGTYAYWTDTVQVSGTTITAGTIDLKVQDQDTVTNFTSMNVSTMVPGETTAGVLTVKNSGTAPLKYYVSALATNNDSKNLAGNLTVKVTGDSTTSASGRNSVCGNGSSSALADSATSLSTSAAANLVGTPAPRQLTSGQSETVCIQLTLQAAAPTSVQGGTTNLSLTFTGTSY